MSDTEVSTSESKVVIGSVADFEQNVPRKVDCALGSLCVIRTPAGFRALDDLCSHETASLSEGEFYDDDMEIECPLHASTFSVDTGEATAPPASDPVRCFSVTVEGDQVVVEG